MDVIDIPFRNSPNQSSRGGYRVEGVIFHFTVSGPFDKTAKWLCDPSSYASAHYLVGREEGEVLQLVRVGRKAWHAGSRTTVPKFHGGARVNARTIGIEVCNWGGLVRRGDTYYAFWQTPQGWGKLIKYKEVPHVVHAPTFYERAKSFRLKDGTQVFPDGMIEYWEGYSTETVSMLIDITRYLCEEFDLRAMDLVGHEDVDPGRKIDPGPVFPWEEIRSVAV